MCNFESFPQNRTRKLIIHLFVHSFHSLFVLWRISNIHIPTWCPSFFLLRGSTKYETPSVTRPTSVNSAPESRCCPSIQTFKRSSCLGSFAAIAFRKEGKEGPRTISDKGNRILSARVNQPDYRCLRIVSAARASFIQPHSHLT